MEEKREGGGGGTGKRGKRKKKEEDKERGVGTVRIRIRDVEEEQERGAKKRKEKKEDDGEWRREWCREEQVSGFEEIGVWVEEPTQDISSFSPGLIHVFRLLQTEEASH